MVNIKSNIKKVMTLSTKIEKVMTIKSTMKNVMTIPSTIHEFILITYDAVTQAIIDRMTAAGSEPSDKMKGAMDKWIVKLIADGDWPNILFFISSEVLDKTQMKINWKNPLYDITEVGTVLHTPGVGTKTDGAGGYLDSNFNWNNFDVKDYSAMTFLAEPLTGNQAPFGVDDGPTRFIAWIRHTDDRYATWHFTPGSLSSPGKTIKEGMFTLSRDPGNQGAGLFWRENILEQTYNVASTTSLGDLNVYLLALNNELVAIQLCSVNVGLWIFGKFALNKQNIIDGHDQFKYDIGNHLLDSDDFNDNILDVTLWIDNDAENVILEQNERLEIITNAIASTNLKSDTMLLGKEYSQSTTVMQFDYILTNWVGPTTKPSVLFFGLSRATEANIAVNEARFFNQYTNTDQSIRFQIWTGAVKRYEIDFALDLSIVQSLKIVVEGNDISAYYWDGSTWAQIGTTQTWDIRVSQNLEPFIKYKRIASGDEQNTFHLDNFFISDLNYSNQYPI